MSDSVAGAVESYKYLGLGTIVERKQDETGVVLSYIEQGTDPAARHDGGDRYTGLDRFGRVIDQSWFKTDSSGAKIAGGDVDRFQYGYDADSNRLFKRNLLSAGNSELYHIIGDASVAYDRFNRMRRFQRGELSPAGSNGTSDGIAVDQGSTSRNWMLDANGKWMSLSDGPMFSVGSKTTVQPEVTQKDGLVTKTSGLAERDLVYDGWNRLVCSYVAGGWANKNATIYTYDALGRLVNVRQSSTSMPNHGDTRELYQSASWQVLREEVRDGNGAAKASYENVWSVAYVDGIVFQEKLGATRTYAIADANWNVTATLTEDTSTTPHTWKVTNRFLYDPYGQVTICGANWQASATSPDWHFFHQGGWLNNVFGGDGLYQFRNRSYDPKNGLWFQPDPMNQGLNPHEYLASNPVKYVDPKGLYVESAWDVFSLGVGLASFIDNIAAGEYGSASLDFVGIVADAVALALPIVPGGAGVGIKAARMASKALQKVDQAANLGQAAYSGYQSIGSFEEGDYWTGALQASGIALQGLHFAVRSPSIRGRLNPRNYEFEHGSVYLGQSFGGLQRIRYRGTKGGVPKSNLIESPNPAARVWAQERGGYVNPRTNTWVRTKEPLAADHVYPQSRIKRLDGFEDLTPAQQNWLLNSPSNFEPLPVYWNSSKLNRLADEWALTPMGRQACPEYIKALRSRQAAFESYARNVIKFFRS